MHDEDSAAARQHRPVKGVSGRMHLKNKAVALSVHIRRSRTLFNAPHATKCSTPVPQQALSIIAWQRRPPPQVQALQASKSHRSACRFVLRTL